ncbi:MAG: FliA/WhiG family RNA polymerase sigma factor [Mariprofundaceae bacterium]
MSGSSYDKKDLRPLDHPERLLETYLPTIRYHAEQLLRRVPDSIEVDDLIDSGVLGLLDAARRFDPDRETQFKTFISYRVRGAMIDYLRAFDWMPRGLRDSSKEMQQALLDLAQKYGRPAEEDEVASHLGVSLQNYRSRLDQVRGMAVVYFDDISLFVKDEDELSFLDTISGDADKTPENQATMLQFVKHLGVAIDQLPARERVLLTLYYYEELTMKEVALVLGLTESRVSQLHSQMVIRLRTIMKLDA